MAPTLMQARRVGAREQQQARVHVRVRNSRFLRLEDTRALAARAAGRALVARGMGGGGTEVSPSGCSPCVVLCLFHSSNSAGAKHVVN